MFYHPRLSFLLGVSFIALTEGCFCIIIFSVYYLTKYLTNPEGRDRRAYSNDSRTSDDDVSDSNSGEVKLTFMYIFKSYYSNRTYL